MKQEPPNERGYRCTQVTVGERGWNRVIRSAFTDMRWVRSSRYGKLTYWNDKVISFDTETTSGTKTETIDGKEVKIDYAYTYIATAAIGDPYYENSVKVVMRTQEHMTMFFDLLFSIGRDAAYGIQCRRNRAWLKHGQKQAIETLERRIQRMNEHGGKEVWFGVEHTVDEELELLELYKTMDTDIRPYFIKLKIFVHNLSYDFFSCLRNFIHTDYDGSLLEQPHPSLFEKQVLRPPEVDRTILDKILGGLDLRSDEELGCLKRYYITEQLMMSSTDVQHVTLCDEFAYARAVLDTYEAEGEDSTRLFQLKTCGCYEQLANETVSEFTGIAGKFPAVCIDFTDSYVLVGTTLAEASKDFPEYLQKRVVRDKDGRVIEADLDYSKIRNSFTVLTEKELNYAMDDCISLNHVISVERCESLGGGQKDWEHRTSMGTLPITKTQKVRTYTRDNTVHASKRYKDIVAATAIKTMEERDFIMQGYHGGFTHANVKWVEQVVKNVDHVDFTSSYPAVLMTETYPMGQPVIHETMTIDEIKELQKRDNVWWMAYIELTNARMKPGVTETPMTATPYKRTMRGGAYIFDKNHERSLKDCVINNRRLISAPYYGKVMCCADWQSMELTVDYDEVKFIQVHVWKADYLPAVLVRSIGELYRLKTELKGVEGCEAEYGSSKGMLNSTYGMMVTDDFRNEYKYEHGAVTCHMMSEEEALERLARINGNKETFLNPLWGIACTAFAQRNLFMAIAAAGPHAGYEDTDAMFYDASCEVMAEYVKWYNEVRVPEKVKAFLAHRGSVDPQLYTPKNKYGVAKPIGVWTQERHCIAFKTVGAKRYLEFVEEPLKDENDNKVLDESGNPVKVRKFYMTVAGANKNKGNKFFNDKYQANLDKGMSESDAMMDCFDCFTAMGNDKYPPFYLDDDKLVAHYLGNGCDELSCNMVLTDENGVSEECHQKYGVILKPTDFKMSEDPSLVDRLIELGNNPRNPHR